MRIPACHAGGPGSIPGGVVHSFLFVYAWDRLGALFSSLSSLSPSVRPLTPTQAHTRASCVFVLSVSRYSSVAEHRPSKSGVQGSIPCGGFLSSFFISFYGLSSTPTSPTRLSLPSPPPLSLFSPFPSPPLSPTKKEYLHTPGIGPGSRPWQGRIIPLDHVCGTYLSSCSPFLTHSLTSPTHTHI